MGKLSKVLSILKIFSTTDFYLSKLCIIQLHLKSALAFMPMNSNTDSKQYVFQLYALALCDIANISTSGYTHTCTWCEHLVLPVLFFWSGKQVLDWDTSSGSVLLGCLQGAADSFSVLFWIVRKPQGKYREMHKSKDVSEMEKRIKMASVMAFWFPQISSSPVHIVNYFVF